MQGVELKSQSNVSTLSTLSTVNLKYLAMPVILGLTQLYASHRFKLYRQHQWAIVATSLAGGALLNRVLGISLTVKKKELELLDNLPPPLPTPHPTKQSRTLTGALAKGDIPTAKEELPYIQKFVTVDISGLKRDVAEKVLTKTKNAKCLKIDKKVPWQVELAKRYAVVDTGEPISDDQVLRILNGEEEVTPVDGGGDALDFKTLFGLCALQFQMEHLENVTSFDVAVKRKGVLGAHVMTYAEKLTKLETLTASFADNEWKADALIAVLKNNPALKELTLTLPAVATDEEVDAVKAAIPDGVENKKVLREENVPLSAKQKALNLLEALPEQKGTDHPTQVSHQLTDALVAGDLEAFQQQLPYLAELRTLDISKLEQEVAEKLMERAPKVECVKIDPAVQWQLELAGDRVVDKGDQDYSDLVEQILDGDNIVPPLEGGSEAFEVEGLYGLCVLQPQMQKLDQVTSLDIAAARGLLGKHVMTYAQKLTKLETLAASFEDDWNPDSLIAVLGNNPELKELTLILPATTSSVDENKVRAAIPEGVQNLIFARHLNREQTPIDLAALLGERLSDREAGERLGEAVRNRDNDAVRRLSRYIDYMSYVDPDGFSEGNRTLLKEHLPEAYERTQPPYTGEKTLNDRVIQAMAIDNEIKIVKDQPIDVLYDLFITQGGIDYQLGVLKDWSQYKDDIDEFDVAMAQRGVFRESPERAVEFAQTLTNLESVEVYACDAAAVVEGKEELEHVVIYMKEDDDQFDWIEKLPETVKALVIESKKEVNEQIFEQLKAKDLPDHEHHVNSMGWHIYRMDRSEENAQFGNFDNSFMLQKEADNGALGEQIDDNSSFAAD